MQQGQTESFDHGERGYGLASLATLRAAEKRKRRKAALYHGKHDWALQGIMLLDVNLLWFKNTPSASRLYIKNISGSGTFRIETKQPSPGGFSLRGKTLRTVMSHPRVMARRKPGTPLSAMM